MNIIEFASLARDLPRLILKVSKALETPLSNEFTIYG